MSGVQHQLVGNRLMLVGALVYLSEWVAIVLTASMGDESRQVAIPGRSAAEIVNAYQGRDDALGFMAGWFSVVLLGRILMMVGLKASLANSGRAQPLMDLAVAAMAVSVALEVAAFTQAAAAAQLGAALPEAIVAVDWSAGWMNRVVAGGIGVAVLSSAWAMWRSGLFRRSVVVLGAIAGGALTTAQALATAPSLASVASTVIFPAALLFWVWMIWTGVLLWRRTPGRIAPASASHSP